MNNETIAGFKIFQKKIFVLKKGAFAVCAILNMNADLGGVYHAKIQ